MERIIILCYIVIMLFAVTAAQELTNIRLIHLNSSGCHLTWNNIDKAAYTVNIYDVPKGEKLNMNFNLTENRFQYYQFLNVTQIVVRLGGTAGDTMIPVITFMLILQDVPQTISMTYATTVSEIKITIDQPKFESRIEYFTEPMDIKVATDNSSNTLDAQPIELRTLMRGKSYTLNITAIRWKQRQFTSGVSPLIIDMPLPKPTIFNVATNDVITNERITGLTAMSFLLKWDEIKDAVFSVETVVNSNETTKKMMSTITNQIEIMNLTDGDKIHFKINGTKIVGSIEPKEINITFRAVPQMIGKLNATDIMDDMMKISWNSNPYVALYQVMYEESKQMMTMNSSENMLMLHSLKMKATYTITVKAVMWNASMFQMSFGVQVNITLPKEMVLNNVSTAEVPEMVNIGNMTETSFDLHWSTVMSAMYQLDIQHGTKNESFQTTQTMMTIKNLIKSSKNVSVTLMTTVAMRKGTTMILIPELKNVSEITSLRAFPEPTKDTISLVWDPIKNVTMYTVEYYAMMESKMEMKTAVNSITLASLKKDTDYTIKVRPSSDVATSLKGSKVMYDYNSNELKVKTMSRGISLISSMNLIILTALMVTTL